jgi:5-methylcytosine-specific restriction enzyme subunit McrC
LESSIPVQNLYYLLCYAWERLEERDLIEVGHEKPPKDLVNLLGRVLVRAVGQLIRRGFERGYRERQEELNGIRGRMIVSTTIRRQLSRYGRADCSYDELEHDTPANRIIKATLTRIACSAFAEDELRHQAIGLRRQFRDVAECRVAVADCHRVIIHRNNRHYGFVLHLCEQLLQMLLPDSGAEGAKFRDFVRDHQMMARLFEKFVRNFYEHHQAECGVSRVTAKKIEWAFDHEVENGIWPGMVSDVCLARGNRPPLIIDCKFYHQVLKETAHGKETLSSANLYQLFTYVQNVRAHPEWKDTEGLLLYAENGSAVNEIRTVLGSRLRVATINLGTDWKLIEGRLLELARG